MANEPRMTAQTLKVLGALLETSRDELAGAEIGQTARLSSGTLYPILARLEVEGWLESRWETEEPSKLGRPRKRFYRITGLGVRKAKEAFQELSPIALKLGVV